MVPLQCPLYPSLFSNPWPSICFPCCLLAISHDTWVLLLLLLHFSFPTPRFLPPGAGGAHSDVHSSDASVLAPLFSGVFASLLIQGRSPPHSLGRVPALPEQGILFRTCSVTAFYLKTLSQHRKAIAGARVITVFRRDHSPLGHRDISAVLSRARTSLCIPYKATSASAYHSCCGFGSTGDTNGLFVHLYWQVVNMCIVGYAPTFFPLLFDLNFYQPQCVRLICLHASTCYLYRHTPWIGGLNLAPLFLIAVLGTTSLESPIPPPTLILGRCLHVFLSSLTTYVNMFSCIFMQILL